MFAKTIRVSLFQVTGSRCEYLILLNFYLQILKPHETVYDANINSNRKSQLAKKSCNYILRKMGLKFQKPNFNNLFKIAFGTNKSG